MAGWQDGSNGGGSAGTLAKLLATGAAIIGVAAVLRRLIRRPPRG